AAVLGSGSPSTWAGGWAVRALALGYAAGVAGGMAWLALGHLGLVWLARRSAEPSPGALATYRALPFAREARRPRLLVAGRVRRPVLIGLVRPLILIPPELDPPAPTPEDRDRLRLGLLHELAHAEAGDPWFTLAGHLAQCLLYALPPLWWLVARMRL